MKITSCGILRKDLALTLYRLQSFCCCSNGSVVSFSSCDVCERLSCKMFTTYRIVKCSWSSWTMFMNVDNCSWLQRKTTIAHFWKSLIFFWVYRIHMLPWLQIMIVCQPYVVCDWVVCKLHEHMSKAKICKLCVTLFLWNTILEPPQIYQWYVMIRVNTTDSPSWTVSSNYWSVKQCVAFRAGFVSV